MAKRQDDRAITHCSCGLHCRSNCAHMEIQLSESAEILAWCALSDCFLSKYWHYLQFAALIFFRTRLCKAEHPDTPTRDECHPVN